MFDFDFDTLEAADVIDVRVVCLDGTACTLSVTSDICIREVKALVEAELAIPRYEQQICCDDKVLTDKSLLQRAQHGKAVNLSLVRIVPQKDDWICRVTRNPLSLSEAPPPIKAHHEVVQTAARLDESALVYAASALRMDCEFVLPLVRQNGSALRYLPATVQADYNVVLAAVQSVGQVLKYASEELRANVQIVLAAVRQDERAVVHASPELIDDPEFVRLAIDTNPKAAEYIAAICIDDKLKEDVMSMNREQQASEMNDMLSSVGQMNSFKFAQTTLYDFNAYPSNT